MALIVLLFLCVLPSWETQGSTPATPVFVQKGNDVLLEVKEPVELTVEKDFYWKLNKTNSVVKLAHNNKPVIFPKYLERATFSDKNHSLLLKNLQQAHSGNYLAQVTGETDRIIAEYEVIVQNPVAPVKLSVDSVPNSTDSCNLTVTCGTQDAHINSTFRCDTQNCTQEGGERSEVTTSGSSLHVYLLDDYIACNHSNQVSQTEARKEIKHFCTLNAVSKGVQIKAIWIVIVCLCICCFFVGIIKYRQKRKKNYGNTIYEVPQNMNPAQSPNQNAPEDATDLSPNSTYAMVGFPTKPRGSTETKNTTLPETIYAQVYKAPRSNHHPELKNTDYMHSQD